MPGHHRPKLLHEIGVARERARVQSAAGSHAAFVGAVSAEDRTVLHERRPHSGTRSGDSRAHPGEATAHNSEIERIAFLDGLAGTRGAFAVRDKAKRIDAAFESREVAKPHLRFPGDVDYAAVFPVPVTVADAKLPRSPVADLDEEAPRAMRGNPVACPHEKTTLPGHGKIHLRHSILDRTANAVRKQIGRVHYVHELLVYYPAAERRKRLGLHEKAFAAGSKTAAFEHRRQKNRPEQHSKTPSPALKPTAKTLVGLPGIEPGTYGLGNRRSVQLSYSPT